MGKIIIFGLILIFLIGLSLPLTGQANGLEHRLSGRILLQVQQKGEAWYVNPLNKERYFLGRPADAFALMRSLGLGVSNRDFDSFAGIAPSRLSGRILLKVEDLGKAYFVNPVDLKLYFLGRPADAFALMRSLGLGITDKDLKEIKEHGQTVVMPENKSVAIMDFAFQPQTVTIKKGATITWTNNDSVTHTVTSSGNFESGNITSASTYSRRFDTAGTFNYHCTPHPNMTGTIIVEE